MLFTCHLLWGRKMAIIFSSLQCSFPQRAPGIQKTMGLMSHIKPCNKQMMLQVPTEFMLKLAMQMCISWFTVCSVWGTFPCENCTFYIRFDGFTLQNSFLVKIWRKQIVMTQKLKDILNNVLRLKTCGGLETQSLWISLFHLGMLYGTQESQFYILSHESFYLYCSTLTRIHLFHVSWQEAGKTWRQATTFTCYVQDKALFAFREKSRKCQATKINPVIVVCWGRIYWEYKKSFQWSLVGFLIIQDALTWHFYAKPTILLTRLFWDQPSGRNISFEKMKLDFRHDCWTS